MFAWRKHMIQDHASLSTITSLFQRFLFFDGGGAMPEIPLARSLASCTLLIISSASPRPAMFGKVPTSILAWLPSSLIVRDTTVPRPLVVRASNLEPASVLLSL